MDLDKNIWGFDLNNGDHKLVPRFESDFKELAFLGLGSYGFVVLARHNIDGAEYAIKKVPFGLLAKTHQQEQLKREVQIMAKLYHPHIVRYHQAWVEKKFSGMHFDALKESRSSYELSREDMDFPCLYIQMEYCPESLVAVYKSIPTWEDRKELYCQVLNGVISMHSMHVLHGDISGNNIFIGVDKKVRIADFGLSRFVDGDKELEDPYSAGTPFYRAPEGGTSLKADVFSLGVLFFETLYGFSSDAQRFELLSGLNEGKLPEPFGFSDSLKSLLLLMLSEDPKTRPSVQHIFDFLTHSLDEDEDKEDEDEDKEGDDDDDGFPDEE